MPPDHWTTAKLRRPGWLPGTGYNINVTHDSRHYEPIVINLGENLRLGSANQLVISQEVAIILTKLPPDHWTTAKFRRPGWLPGTVATPDIMILQSSF